MPTIFTRMFRDYETKIQPTTPQKTPPHQQPVLSSSRDTLPADTEEDLNTFQHQFADNVLTHLNSTQPSLQMKPARKIDFWNPNQVFRKWRSKRQKPVLTTCDEAPLQQRVATLHGLRPAKR